MRPAWMVRRALAALLVMTVAACTSVWASGRAAENRVASDLVEVAQRQGASAVYVWPSAAPDAGLILERNGMTTRLCADEGTTGCYPQVYIYRSVAANPFVVSVRWQYSRDHHGVGGTRRFVEVFGLIRELSPEGTFIQ